MAALGELLDASVEQIAQAAASGHVYDRQAVVRLSDVWDNNTGPFFAAATRRTPRGRELAARRALSWLADFGSRRRAWVERTAQVTGLLPPMRSPAPERPLAELAEAYDLDQARLSGVLVEREGPERISVQVTARLSGVKLWLTYPDVDRLDFQVHAGGGPVPRLSCPGASGFTNDRPGEPWTQPPRPSHAVRGSEANRAARLLHTAMLQIRSLRRSRNSDLRTVRALAQALHGAGADIRTAGERHWGHERAFGALSAEWLRRAGPVIGPWWEATATRQAPWRNPPTAPPPPLDLDTARLRMVSYAAGELTAQLVAPDGSLHVVGHTGVDRLTISAERPWVAVAGAVRLGSLR